MLCQHCKKRQANTHIVRTIGNTKEELYLCSECAKQGGYVSGFSVSDFLFGGGLAATKLAERCPDCNATFSQISKSGYVGCARCYEFFSDRLTPTIASLHSSPVHKGKAPKGKGYAVSELKEEVKSEAAEKKKAPRLTKAQKIEKLKNEQKEAIAAEDFETAARLRDEIKKLEGGKSNG